MTCPSNYVAYIGQVFFLQGTRTTRPCLSGEVVDGEGEKPDWGGGRRVSFPDADISITPPPPAKESVTLLIIYGPICKVSRKVWADISNAAKNIDLKFFRIDGNVVLDSVNMVFSNVNNSSDQIYHYM